MPFDLTFPCYLTTISGKKILSGKVICAFFCPAYRSSPVFYRAFACLIRIVIRRCWLHSDFHLETDRSISVLLYIPENMSGVLSDKLRTMHISLACSVLHWTVSLLFGSSLSLSLFFFFFLVAVYLFLFLHNPLSSGSSQRVQFCTEFLTLTFSLSLQHLSF
jgi:hypothetical protein